MSAPDMADVYAKVNRARDALSSLGYDVAAHCEIERRQQEMNIIQGAPLPKGSDEPLVLHDFSARIGEIAYNLRSALDHLVWQLVLANAKTPGLGNAFPICQDEDQYRRVAKGRLQELAEQHQELIEGFQLYRENGGIGAHLRMLHIVCNIDKHRHLNVVNVHSSTTTTRHEDQVRIDVKVGVCFRDKELEAASPGYASALEGEGMKRPPVIPALQSSLDAVVAVTEQLTGKPIGLGSS